MPSRQKRKREAEPTPPPPSRRRSGGREASGAEPPVGRKNNPQDSEGATLDADTLPVDGNQKDPLESDQSNNPLDAAVAKEQGNGVAINGKPAGEGNDHAEPLKENATRPLHEKEETQGDAADTAAFAPENSKKGKQSTAKSAGGKSDSRIQTILSHRKLLLARLRQGRKVVRNRLEAAFKKNPALKDQKDEQEIISFQLLAKEATSLARKTKVTDVESTGEKRTSVSLRRGSSVGKKMNAALSSLAPGITSVAAAAVVSAAGAAAPVAAPVAAPPVPKAAPLPPAPAVKSTSSSIPPSSAPIPQATPSVSISLPKKTGPAKAVAKTSRPATSPRVSTAPGVPPPFSHTNLLGTPSRVAQPVANVPDCIALRERRRAIRSKLSALAPPDFEPSSSLKDKSKNIMDELRVAKQSLPPRRKTHWDYLLEEMKWMATDFKHERNWKVSAARSLCHGLEQQRKDVVSDTKMQIVCADDDIVTESTLKDTKAGATIEQVASEKGKLDLDGRVVAKKISAMIESFAKEYASVVDKRAGDDAKAKEGEKSQVTEEGEPASATTESKEAERETMYKTISDIAGKASKSIRLPKSPLCKVDGTQLHLSSEQNEALCLLEDKLSVTASGAILEGSYASGKTVAILALLSRTNGDGPHLVICPSETMVKWMDRAQYFQHIQVRSVASTLKDGEVLKENDVVLCDHAGMYQLEDSRLGKFKSVVVDCRHPWGYRGSKWAVTMDDPKELANILSEFYPREILSVSWWTRLSAFCGSSCTRQLLVENKNSGDFASMLGGLRKRTQLDLIALRLAFVAGISVDKKHRIPIPKLVIGWARKQIKGAKGQGTKFDNVSRELVRILDSFACPLSRGDVIEDVGGFGFDVQKCEMTPLQRLTYEQQCAESRRLLSAPLAEVDPMFLEQTASCLLNLRRTCFHSELDALLRSHLVQSSMYALASPLGKKHSASQPNQELASRMMECSGKLSQLASFLSSESSASLSKETQNLVWRKDGKRKSAKVKHSPMKNKIVILASLPEIQRLVSLFLCSLGIDHEYIPDQFSPPLNSIGYRAVESYGWIRGQTRLTGFNHQNVDDPAATNVVVCSLTTVAGDHGGVGVDTADAVICVDEDWSGRGELMFNALLHRLWYALNKTCKLIKLVSADTCEEHFLANGDFGQLNPKPLKWHVNPLGNFACSTQSYEKDATALASMLERRHKPESWFGFPGLNIFASSNEALDDTLSAATPLPRKFGSSGQMVLLPCHDDEPSRNAFANIIMRLVQTETSGNWRTSPAPSLIHAQGLLRSFEFAGSTFCNESFLGSYRETTEPDANSGLLLGSPSAILDDVIENMDVDQSDQEEVDGPKRAPRESLYYALPANPADSTQSRRSNALVDSFAFRNIHEQRSASEVVPYFPPLFPRMLETSIAVENSMAARETTGVKRPMDAESEGDSAAKRVRDDSLGTRPNESSKVTDAGASEPEASSLLRDPVDDYGLAGAGVLPLQQDSILAAALEEFKDSTKGSPATESMILIVTRKRQRPGHPLVPPPGQSVTAPGPQSGTVAPSVRTNPSTNAVNLDITTGKNLKKKVASQPPAPSGVGKFRLGPEDATQIARGQQPPPSASQGIRMKEAIRGRYLASSRQSGIGTSIFEVPSFRAAYGRIRHRLRNCTSRDCWHSSAIIDAGPGIPLHACKREARTSGEGPVERSLWTNVIKKPGKDNSITGEEAIIVAAAQKAAIRKSLSAPCRVDFGPFQSGFLSSPTGMTAIVPPRPRSGVSLPMGVKVPPPLKELHVPWTDQEEKTLQDCVLRFGTNWMLAARTLSGVQDVETVCKQSSGNRPLPRAGRSCREHWHVMARNEANLARELRQAERLQREKASHRFVKEDYPLEQSVTRKQKSKEEETEFDVSSTTDFFTVSSVVGKTHVSAVGHDDEKMVDASEVSKEASPAPQKRRLFSAIASARTKKIQLPRTIPGVEGGSQPSISPSHPSHMQAVQKSATAKWSGGRTDMWPIQFLDAADRHRSPPPQSAAPQQRPQAASSARNHGTSSTAARPAYPPGAHRVPSTGAARSATDSGANHPPASTRPPSSATMQSTTMQSFAPPSSKARQSDDKKPAPK